MIRQVLPKSALSDWINHLLQNYRVIAPVAVQGFLRSEKYIRLKRLYSIIQPQFCRLKKRYCLRGKTYSKFDLAHYSIVPVQNSTPTVITWCAHLRSARHTAARSRFRIWVSGPTLCQPA